ncbi:MULTISPECIES: hypothetical protein [Erwinia]|uniref:hypothetical protein n=1 Tax=Erwinia TaxID=551 RepID=UPI0006901EC9|nr:MULTISPECIES: hypothetical protein [Erwinia]
MNKKHFYQRLTRWQHLRFNDVILRERPDTPAWDKKYEIYIQDNSRPAAQLYIRTTQSGENTTLVMEEYLNWLAEYNQECEVSTHQENPVIQFNRESRRVAMTH